MKVFGKEVGKAIKFPPFIERFAGKVLPRLKGRINELVSVPSTNISDEETAFELSVALPGLDKKNVNIQLQGNTLIISGEKEQSQEVNEKHWVRKEFVRNAFYRAFEVPPNADPDRINAKMKDGLLQIRIVKKDRVRKKQTLKVA
ncbi:Hsp20/alpha crystallin family protein [Flagellimonas sp. SN16]|uniref:Hsp20/alpha crystallin family protein n=1 Tax=Flagellimonas sp. SN16 TaxID=3415142 RepID=UPI003C6272BD